jgi:hypothetical protein
MAIPKPSFALLAGIMLLQGGCGFMHPAVRGIPEDEAAGP